MKKEKIINGCEFQNGCIEYKDISYLKVMPICAVYELSIACHDKENKCKYYQVYKQLKRLQEENKELKEKAPMKLIAKNIKYHSALEEIRNIAEKLITELPEYNSCYYKDECGNNCTPKKQSKNEYCCYENADKILTIINEVLNK